MASIIKTSIDVSKIPADKIIKGKKGKYVPVVITLNNDVDKFGYAGSITMDQTKDERDAKAEKIYLGNVSVVWTDGNNVDRTPMQERASQNSAAAPQAPSDLPF